MDCSSTGFHLYCVFKNFFQGPPIMYSASNAVNINPSNDTLNNSALYCDLVLTSSLISL